MSAPDASLAARLRAHALRDECSVRSWGEEPTDISNDLEDAADALDEAAKDTSRWYSPETMAAVVKERDQLLVNARFGQEAADALEGALEKLARAEEGRAEWQATASRNLDALQVALRAECRADSAEGALDAERAHVEQALDDLQRAEGRAEYWKAEHNAANATVLDLQVVNGSLADALHASEAIAAAARAYVAARRAHGEGAMARDADAYDALVCAMEGKA